MEKKRSSPAGSESLRIINELRKNGHKESAYISLYDLYQRERIKKERYLTSTVTLSILLGSIIITAIIQSI